MCWTRNTSPFTETETCQLQTHDIYYERYKRSLFGNNACLVGTAKDSSRIPLSSVIRELLGRFVFARGWSIAAKRAAWHMKMRTNPWELAAISSCPDVNKTRVHMTTVFREIWPSRGWIRDGKSNEKLGNWIDKYLVCLLLSVCYCYSVFIRDENNRNFQGPLLSRGTRRFQKQQSFYRNEWYLTPSCIILHFITIGKKWKNRGHLSRHTPHTSSVYDIQDTKTYT